MIDEKDFKQYVDAVIGERTNDDLVLRAYDTWRGKATPEGVLAAARHFNIAPLLAAHPSVRVIEADWYVHHTLLKHEYPNGPIGFGASLLTGYNRYVRLRDGGLTRTRLNKEIKHDTAETHN